MVESKELYILDGNTAVSCHLQQVTLQKNGLRVAKARPLSINILICYRQQHAGMLNSYTDALVCYYKFIRHSSP